MNKDKFHKNVTRPVPMIDLNKMFSITNVIAQKVDNKDF